MKKFFFIHLCHIDVFRLWQGRAGDELIIGPAPTGKVTWATIVKTYPFLDGFPVFDGEVENCQYKELGSMKTLTFFDYKCDKSVSTTYYAKFIPAGFTKSEGSEIYRKTVDKKNYIFSGSYGGGSFGLSFSVDTE